MLIPLCPEHFLLRPRTNGKEEEREVNVSKEFQQRKKWLSSMNELWKKEYIHQVLVSHGEVWTTQPNPLKEEKRLNWKMFVVQKLIIGRDGRCRAAVVQVNSGLLMNREKKAVKGEVPPPRRTRSGGEVACPHSFRDHGKCSCKMLMQVKGGECRKQKHFGSENILDLYTF